MKRWLISACLLVACGTEGGAVLHKDVLDAETASRTPDVAPPETVVEPEVVLPEMVAQDVDEELFVECLPGEGCFGEPCDEGADCLSGFCVDHLGNKVCSQSCVEECPGGWSCEPTQMGGSDLVYVCLSRAGMLCRPCVDNGDCVGVDGQEYLCLDYGPAGRFCGAPCESSADCPGGYLCQEAGDGGALQCLHGEGECPCSDTAIDLALQTVCSADNEHGSCQGKRVCKDSGLTECDAAAPSIEECDGKDNDCDGETDEGTCDDGNPCTEDLCQGADGCANTPLESGSCDDGDLCTVTDHCVAGACVGTAIQCDDGNPCTDDSCDGTQGCLFQNNTAACDDGDPCTVGDLCLQGSCKGTPVDCQCQDDGDCAAFEDGDLCNGTLYCDKSGVQFLCKVAPATVVECPAAPGKDGACLLPLCVPATGKCTFQPANEGLACDDKDSCTANSVCQAGACTGGVALNCNDGNPCTADSCQPGAGCINAPQAGSCSDGNACTWPDVCADGVCVGGPPLECDDSNPCTGDTCNPESGCKHAPLSGACDDGNACTSGDKCQGGFCVPSGMKNCDDGNACTNDSCHPASGCLHEFNSVPCSDDDLCTVNDLCDQGECVGGKALGCDDGNPCTNDTCNPLVGCKHTAHSGACDDGDPCTEGDTCSGGACVGSVPKDCDDGNPCTNDLCVPMAGCSHTNNKNPCNDGSACTLNDKCAQGTCVPGAPVDCDDDNPCTTDSCNPATGCEHGNSNEECDDGNACTTGDTCTGGVCKGSGSLECDDGNPCTKDICLPGGGCQHQDAAVPCSDGNPCTVDDTCVQGQCQPGLQKDCDDANPCTDDSCGDGGACVHAANEAACDDDNPCTVGDHCAGGKCVPEGPLDCDDEEVCTTDYCHPLKGCVHDLNTNPCDDGDACTVGDLCAEGSCVGTVPVNCNDGNLCTDDSCDPQTGCLHVANAAPCDDGNLCTVTDLCNGGQCKGTGSKSCGDGNLCTDDSCDPEEGCLHTPNSVPCDDDNACTVTDVCDGGQCKGTGAPDCNDGNVCTDDSCDPDSGCLHANNSAACSDGNACTINDACSGGTCQGGGALTCNDNDPCTDDSCDPDTGCVYTDNAECCVPSGNRAPFNSLSADTASGCWNANPCSTSNYSWNGTGQNFQAFGQYITCSGSQTCVQNVGITTYEGSGTVCQGKWDVYCDNVKQCTINTLGKTCTGSSLTNGCKCTFADGEKCTAIKLVAVSDGDGTLGCCGGSQPDTMITSVSAW
jgi:hypothetical protein